MKLDHGPVPIDLARELVEEALVAASKRAGAELQAAFLHEKEAVHSIETVDIREKELDALDSHWVDRLQVAAPLEELLARQPGLEGVISHCFVRLARAKQDERVFLYAGDAATGIPLEEPALPALVVQLTVDTLLAIDGLEPLLTTTIARARGPS